MDEIRSLVEALEDPDRSDAAAERLAACGAAAVPWVLARLRSPDAKGRRVLQAVLVRIGPPAVDSLCELLRSRYEPDQLLAAEALGRIGDRRAVVPLCDLLWSRSDRLTITAAEALAQIGDPRASDPLFRTLATSGTRVRAAVIRALNAIGSEVSEVLLAALDRPRDGAWCTAAEALVEFEDRRVIGPLRAALADPSAAVRCTAADGLGRLGDANDIPGLCALLRDPDGYVREAAGAALEHLAVANPVRELRQALQSLDRLAWAEKVLPWEERTFAKAALTIRSVTAELAERPIPAVAPEVVTNGLPVPAPASGSDANELPIPGSLPDANPAVRTRRAAWWTIRSRRRG